MQIDRTNLGWMAAAAALAGGAAYYFSNTGMRVRMTRNNDIAFDRTTELGRVSPEAMLTGAAVTVALGGLALWQLRKNGAATTTSIRETEEMIEIDVPVHVAYNQWTQFEAFPRFMPTVSEVRQLDDSHLRWRANVAGKVVEWNSEIVEQIPDERIEWRSTSGPRNGGVVTFDKVGDQRTRVILRMWYEPQSANERIGGALGAVKLTAKGNLMRFRQLLEKAGRETGAWRGEIGAQAAH